jgi:methionine biosynthesis protein MetW
MSINAIQKFQNKGWEKQCPAGFSKKTVLDLINDDSILDIGCGDGLLLKEISRKNPAAKLTGLDISPRAIEIARSRGLECRLFDITQRLPFDDNSFDAVLLLDILEHLFEPEEVLKEACRVTRKHIYISVPNFISLPARLQMLFGHVPENNSPRKGHVYWMTYGVLKQLINRADLKIEKIKMNTFWTNPLFNLLVRIFPNWLALSFVTKVKK